VNPSSGVLSKRNWKALNISSDVAEGLTPIKRK
jgi:hypothetical protein